MTHPVSILLPGLDGTGNMFERFVALAPSALPVRVQPLPADFPRSYSRLADALLPQLPQQPFALIAESFSGPLAILLATRCPQARAVVLCATFVRPPLPRLLARAPNFFWQKTPPRLLLQLAMAAGDPILARALHDTVVPLDKGILRARVDAALTVDVTHDLERLAQPVLYLRAQRDRIVPARCAADIRKWNPSTEIAEVDGPHLLLQSRPVESWRVIAPFLERAFQRAAS